MPILFAFYAMLSVAIELRGAPFGGWIHDLAASDPLYITPIIMGGTMFWQQRMMPTTADPVQQKSLPVSAGHLHRHVPHDAERPGAVLDGQQPAGDRAADRDQSPDCSACEAGASPSKGPAMTDTNTDLDSQVIDFVTQITGAMGLDLDVAVEETPDHIRLNLVAAKARTRCCGARARRSTRCR